MREERILLIEGSGSQRRMVAHALERAGYLVVAAQTGDEGFRLLAETMPQLVLLETAGHGLDGWRTLEQIRAVSEVPAIMLLARGEKPDVARRTLSGADDFVAAPFSRLELAARIEAVLGRAGVSGVDEVTGLPNHRAFPGRLDALLAARGELSLVLFASDELEAADEALREVAGIARRKLRAEDQLFRLGGSEFAALVRGDHEVGVFVGERLRAALLARGLPTLSAGVAAFPVDGGTKEELIRAADVTLRAARRADGHRVLAHAELSSPAGLAVAGQAV